MPISLHEFIKTEGYSYIDFGIKCKSTLKIQVGLKMAQATGGQIIGGNGSGENDAFRFFNYGNQAYLDFGSGEFYNRIHGGTISPNTYYDIEIGNRYVKNMSTGGYFCSSSSVSFADKTYSLKYAFNDTECIGWLYYIKIYDSDVLVIDGVPALRGSKTGIYDKVNKKFIENSGTKEFILGKQIGTVSDGTVSDRKYLISDSDKYYTVVDSALSEISITELNAQAFKDYGFDYLPDGTLLTTLPHPKLLYWQDSEEELPNITAKVTATPNGQYISKVIDLSNASIIGIKAVTVKCTGTPWFSCSFDGGETWKEYSGGAWVDVVSYGMTEETIEAITSDEWNTAVSGIDSFVMRVLLRSPADSLTNLSVNFLNKTT